MTIRQGIGQIGSREEPIERPQGLSNRSRIPAPANESPPVEELLDVDREYRERAAAGTLYRIAPRRMNPHHEAWLPILHTTRGPRHYTALYSNTPHAHEQHATHDWVVLYFDHDGRGGERQCTVITSRFGPLAGHRIVRGREDECLRLMRRRELAAAIGARRADLARLKGEGDGDQRKTA
jgi:hypothetical protein